MQETKDDIIIRWLKLRIRLKERFGIKPDMDGILFLIGIQELGQDIAVGTVDLDPVEPGLLGPDGGGDDIVAKLLDLGGRQGARARFGIGEGALRVCAGMVAFTSAVEIALALVSHRGWNHRGLVRIVFGLVWIAAAPGFVPVHTAAGGFILVCGYSVGTLVSVLLELRAAQRRGEIQLGQAIHQGG